MARFRHLTAAESGWIAGAPLPHTARDIDHFWDAHGGGGSLPIRGGLVHTRLVNHGEGQYALQAMDSTDGWSEWSIHRQTGPDPTDPDHWESLATGRNHQFCDCDHDDPVGYEYDPGGYGTGMAGGGNASPGDPNGLQAAKRNAERAWDAHVADQIAQRDRNLGIGTEQADRRGLDPDEGYDIFGEREAGFGRLANLDPDRAAELLSGHRTDHRGRNWWDEYGHLPPDRFLTHDMAMTGHAPEGPLKPLELEWRDGPDYVLPHVRREIDEINRNFGKPYRDEHDLQHSFWPIASQSNAIKHHGENRYGLEVGDGGWDIAGHLWYWRLHRQTGPDIGDPEHWEQIEVPHKDIPYGEQIAWSPDVARAHAEQALKLHIDRLEQERDRNLDIGGDYRPDAPPQTGDDFDYGFGDDFGGRR